MTRVVRSTAAARGPRPGRSRKGARRRGFTYLELVLSLVILAVLSAALIPSTRNVVKRQKELGLQRSLLEMREAIDRFKEAVDNGKIVVRDREQLGYPADFEQLVAGAPLADKPEITMRFLRRIPVDPITGEAEWGMRSVQDPVDSESWGGENLFDVYSKSDGVALDGTKYGEW
jgi:general secretion pathway protein G